MDTLEERIIWWQPIFKDTELICKSSRFISIYEKIGNENCTQRRALGVISALLSYLFHYSILFLCVSF